MKIPTTIDRLLHACAVTAAIVSCGAVNTSYAAEKALFSNFDYRVGDIAPQPDEAGSLPTPLLPGCYPDPSVVRVGKDYYLVNSSFAFFPGVPIWHSTDMKNWERLGYVLNRRSQLDLPDDQNISAGIYAPDISYNPRNKTFYMITTLVGNGGTFYVKTKDPKSGVWSDPVWLPEVGGIDPSILFDKDGKAYIVNNDAPMGKELYVGHRTIRIHDFDWKNDRVTGKQKVIVDGGVNIAEKPIWIEGPHLYNINGKYYLMCAEGGTGDDHREVIFKSSKPYGPFKPCERNPILTQRDLDPSRFNPVTCAGHADLVEDADGNWWAVFLGVRPYSADGHDIMGRETFIHPVRWEKGQPIITDPRERLVWSPRKERENRLWDQDSLVNDAFMIRKHNTDFYNVSDGVLEIRPSDISLYDRKSPSAIGRWVTENRFDVGVTVDDFEPAGVYDIAGLMLFQDDNCNIVLGKSADADGKPVVKLMARSKNNYSMNWDRSLSDRDKPLNLRISADGKGDYRFSYSEGDGEYTDIPFTLPAELLSTKTAGNFTGTMVGVYAVSGNYVKD